MEAFPGLAKSFFPVSLNYRKVDVFLRKAAPWFYGTAAQPAFLPKLVERNKPRAARDGRTAAIRRVTEPISRRSHREHLPPRLASVRQEIDEEAGFFGQVPAAMATGQRRQVQ